MLSLLYLVVRALFGLLVSAGQPSRADGSKDLEILVLRRQLRVLQRTASPPRLRTIDRVLPAAASRVLPRDRWVAFLVTPPTLLRWHRELVRRKWTYRKTVHPRRPRIDAAIREPTDVRILPALAGGGFARPLLVRPLRDDARPSPDHRPSGRSRPLYLVNGFSGHGFQHVPIAGKLVAEMIVEGRAHTVDVPSLGLDRFAAGRLIRETHVV